MPTHLHDLLPAVKEIAPPMRHTADDVLRQGRRRRARRRAAWLSGAAAVAVAGVLIAPQLLAPPETPAPAPAATRPPRSTVLKPAPHMQGNIASVTVGTLTITDTVLATSGYQVARIYERDTQPSEQHIDTDGKVHRIPAASGLVTLFNPGVLDPAPYLDGESLTINGKPGKYVTAVSYGDVRSPAPAVFWEYADDAFAVVTNLGGRGSLTKDELISVAKIVRTAAARPITIGFKIEGVPPGFQVDAAGQVDSSLNSALDGDSYLRLIKGGYPYRKIAGPFKNPVVQNKQLPMIEFRVFPAWWSSQGGGKGVSCDAYLCYRATDNGKYVIEVSAGEEVAEDDLRKMTEALVFADPADRSTWFKATDSAR